jgi:phosphoribosylaminoimidazole-succinocarboxamide synthase
MKLPDKVMKEGKAKVIYEKEDGNLLMKFKDDLTALDGLKHDQMPSKGKYNSVMTAHLLKLVADAGIPTHLVSLLEPGLMEVKKVEIIPVEAVLRNVATGSMVRRLPLEAGSRLPSPVIEFYLKDDALHDPWINDDHVRILGLATAEELKRIRELTLKVNDVLLDYFASKGLVLADFKLEFGRLGGDLVLADEITPDTMRIFDAKEFEKGRLVEYDKQIFRDGGSPEDIKAAYDEAFRRIVGEEPPF